MSETTKTIDDGGYAFPIPADDKAGWHAESGMTLRDWFAGQALSSIGSSWSYEETRVEFARRSYLMADAMIAARKGGSL